MNKLIIILFITSILTQDPHLQHYRILIGAQNTQKIQLHNAKNPSFTLKAYPKFIQFTLEQLVARLLTEIPFQIPQQPITVQSNTVFQVQPSTNPKVYLHKDWQAEGRVTDIKDQGYCGSCWAFAACADIQSSFLFRNKHYDLSQQQLLQCTFDYGNRGCQGGWMGFAFDYIINHGIKLQSHYPYRQQTFSRGRINANKCNNSNAPSFRISSYRYVSDRYATSCSRMTKYVLSRPITTAISASTFQFIFYSSGILNVCGVQVNHAVQVVGVHYDRSGLNYWKIKNSWGVAWGEKGYMLIDRSRNEGNLCSICTYAIFSII